MPRQPRRQQIPVQARNFLRPRPPCRSCCLTKKVTNFLSRRNRARLLDRYAVKRASNSPSGQWLINRVYLVCDEWLIDLLRSSMHVMMSGFTRVQPRTSNKSNSWILVKPTDHRHRTLHAPHQAQSPHGYCTSHYSCCGVHVCFPVCKRLGRKIVMWRKCPNRWWSRWRVSMGMDWLHLMGGEIIWQNSRCTIFWNHFWFCFCFLCFLCFFGFCFILY